MRSVILSTYDIQGGAARAAWRLHKGLLHLGHESAMLTKHRKSAEPAVCQANIEDSPGHRAYLAQLDQARRTLIETNRTDISNTYFSLPYPGYDLSVHPLVQEADVLNLHWVSELLSPETIARLHQLGKPMVWTLHDQRAFTGGCHYSAGCAAFESSCAICPQLRDNSAQLTQNVLATARRLLPRNLTLVAPSRWMAECARRSFLFGQARIEHIPYGIETDVFLPEDKARAREALGLEPHGFYFLFGADSCFDKRKGFEPLLASIALCLQNPAFKEKAAAGRVRFISFGYASEQYLQTGLPIRPLGHFDSDHKLRSLYSAADVFLLPSLEDNLPNTIIEAMSCGTAVIATDAGGIPELISHERTGLLVPVNQPQRYAAAMLFACEHPEQVKNWQHNALRHAQEHFPLEVQARKYVQLFEELLSGWPRSQGQMAPPASRILPALEDSARLVSEGLIKPNDLNNGMEQPELHKVIPDQALLRGKLLSPSHTELDHGPWPYACPDNRPLPATLPGGKAWPRITVVTPSFNQGRFLEETLLSVLNQHYPNLEYIVMDGGSPDESISILQKYGARLSFWASEKDRGQCHAINKGFARATGEILTWLNSDDMLAPGALAAVALGFHLSGADMVTGICQLHQDGTVLNQHLTSCEDGPLSVEELLDQEHCWDAGQFFYQPEVFFTRNLWEKAGGHLDESLYFSLDYELWLRFASAGARLKVLGAPLALYRVHQDQKTYHTDQYRPELRKVREEFMAGKDYKSKAASACKEKLRVVLVNDLGFRYGAGIAHKRLAQALIKAGHQVAPVAIRADPLEPDAPSHHLGPKLLQTIRAQKPDVVLVGNLHAARLDPEVLARISAEWPTVFVLHDGWLLTGRCAYPGACTKYLIGCDQSCPTPNEYPSLAPERIHDAWKAKRELISNSDGLVLAANSRWLLGMADSVFARISELDGPAKSVRRLIRYGVPFDVFKPRDQRMCRELLGLPQDKFVLLFCCTNVADARKGAAHLIEALQRLAIPDLLPVCIGVGGKQLQERLPEILALGYAHQPLQQALLYSAADLFVAPSLEEAFGQVFIEAAACGTPSVAYPVGGVPEALADGVSGCLAASVAPEELARTISSLHAQPQLRRDLAVWGELYVKTHFSLASSYHTLWLALRDALAARGARLAPSITFQSQTDTPMPEVDYLLDSEHLSKQDTEALSIGMQGRCGLGETESALEKRIEEYYSKRLQEYRQKSVPWVLHPGAWLSRMNRNELRKKRRGR